MAHQVNDFGSFWAERLQSLRDELESDNRRIAINGYAIHEMTATPISALLGLFQRSTALDESMAASLARAVWDVLVDYLTAFNSRRISPARAEEIVNVACACLSEMDQASLDEVVSDFWQREKNTTLRWSGANRVLRIAAGVFPQTFNPLLRLLTVLIIDEETAGLVCDFLASGLESLTEMSQGYAHLLISVDNEPRALSLMRSVRSKEYEKVLTITTPSELKPVFVQAQSVIPPLSYRPVVPQASFGSGCEETGAVTWAIPWNGWEALFEILRLFARQIRQLATQSQFSEVDIGNFLVSARTALEFIAQISLDGYSIRSRIATDMNMLQILNELFIELADYSDSAQLSWLTRPLRELYLDKTASCLAALALGDTFRARSVLDQITAERGSSFPLRTLLSSLGSSCFPAVSAFACIANSYYSELHLSNGADISTVISIASGKNIVIDRRCMAAIATVLTESALPVWNSMPLNRRIEPHLSYEWWDFPKDVLAFMQCDPASCVSSLPLAKTVTKILAKATSSTVESETPRVVYSIIDCTVACLELISNCMKFISMNKPKGEVKKKQLTFLQSALLAPETLTALALMCSGCATLLNEGLVSAAQETSSMRIYAALFETKYSSIDMRQMSVSELKQHVEDLSANCLSLLFRSLHSGLSTDDIIQAPWPIIESSLTEKHRPWGRMIRDGFAKRLKDNGSLACAELLRVIIGCGQRVAFRSLLDPFPVKRTLLGTTKPLNDTRASTENEDADAQSADTCILTSVVKFIRDGLDNWTKVMVIPEDGSQPSREETIECWAQSRIVSKYVRLLTMVWESHNHFWFTDFWQKEQIWLLLASILKVDGRSSFNGFNLALAVESKNLNPIDPKQVRETVEVGSELPVLFIHPQSFWRRTAADVLSLFASEILVCAGKASKTVSHVTADEEARANSKKLREDLFAAPQFVAFGEAFTERWIHVLLQPDDWLMYPRMDDTEQESMVLESSWEIHSSLESTTAKFSSELVEALSLSTKPQTPLLNAFIRDSSEDNFGSNYKYDITLVWSLLARANVSAPDAEQLVADLMQLNSMWARADVQIALTRAFCAMAYSVVFADVFAPLPGKALSYASPQFCGKLCRCLSRFLVALRTPTHFTARTLEVQQEMAQLLSFLSARLTQEELEQQALTAVRFMSDLDEEHNYGLKKSPLGQLCFVVDLLLPTTREGFSSEGDRQIVMDVVKNLLVSASYLNRGVAFRMDEDLKALEVTCFDTMRTMPWNSVIAQSAASAIMSLQSCSPDRLRTLFSDTNASQCVFETVSSLKPTCSKSGEAETSPAAGASSLLLMLARVMTWLPNNSEERLKAMRMSLRSMSGGSLTALFPRGTLEIPTYNATTRTRDPLHMAWCACLTLASLSMKYALDDSKHVRNEHLEQDVMEFAACNLDRICLVSLNLYGDWPPQDSSNHAGPQYLTIARIGEAEVAAQTLYQLSFRAVELVNRLPEKTHQAIVELLKFVRHVYKILRNEPIERSVKPVTDQEKFRSEFTRRGKDLPISTGSILIANSPHANSPSTPGPQNSPPLRSPRQSIMASISGSGGRTPLSIRNSPLTSPAGLPSTPQTAPSPHRTFSTPSPVPWTPHGSGLISEGGLLFGDECATALLRGLNMALGALRNLGKAFHEPFVEPAVRRSEGYLDFGTLVGLMYYCMTEIQRHKDDLERREIYAFVVENILHLAVSHLAIYEDRGVLDTGFRNEVANKLNTVVSRLRKIVPPIHQLSIIHTTEIDDFIRGLQQLL